MCDGFNARYDVGTSSNGLAARLAVPDSSGVTLDRDLSAEGACVAGVLGDFDLLDLLTERSTVTEGKMYVSDIPHCCSIVILCAIQLILLHPPLPGDRQGFSQACAPPSILFHLAGFGGTAYRVPYLPVIPTFFVRFVILSVVCGGRNVE